MNQRKLNRNKSVLNKPKDVSSKLMHIEFYLQDQRKLNRTKVY